MKHKAQYTNLQLRTGIKDGQQAFPVFGRPVGQKPVYYDARMNFDPKPWTDGFFRYFGWELTLETPHKPNITDGQWADQRHMIEDTNTFIENMAHAVGVAV